MPADLIAVLVTIAGSVLAGTIAVIAVVVQGQRTVRAAVKDIATDVSAVRDRVSRMEGVLSTVQDVLLRDRTDRGAA